MTKTSQLSLVWRVDPEAERQVSANAVFNQLPDHSIMMLNKILLQGSEPFEFLEERLNTNYDHPFAFDNDLLIQHVGDFTEL